MLSRMFIAGMLFASIHAVASTSPASSEKEITTPNAPEISDDIEDNSFLIEEAYNQEKGVEQHIQSFQFMTDGSFLYTFTEESPVGGREHQASVTVPYLRTSNDAGKQVGVGDILLNYRYQLVDGPNYFVAPRFSFILPTGDSTRGTGSGALGYQVNLPLSHKIAKNWITHWNLGATFIPGRKDTSSVTFNYFAVNYGASMIWLTSHVLNFMFEVYNPDTSQAAIYLNPGARYAFNFKSGLQIVPGVAFPIGVANASGSYGVYTYLSFEHPLY